MGVIVKESFQYSVVNFVGLFFSIVATLVIYPLDWATYGLLQFVQSLSQLLLPILSFGFISSSVKFFPAYKQANTTGELFVLAGVVIAGMSVLFIAIYPLIQTFLYSALELLGFDLAILKNYQQFILAVAIVSAFSTLVYTFISNYRKIVIPSILVELSVKIIIPALVILKVFADVSITSLLIIFFIYHIIVLVALFLYYCTKKDSKLKVPGLFTRSRLREITEFSSFSMFNILAYTLVYRLDIIMITLLMGAKYTGYYSLLLFIANVIEIPGKAIIKISGPMIASLLQEDNLTKIKELYQKASTNLMLICGIIGLVIFAGLDSLFSLMKDGNVLIGLINVWIVLVVGKWVNQITSINSHIITYSRYYKWGFYFLAIQAVINIVFNYYFIVNFGLIGAAMATALSIIVNNLLKMVFIKIKYDMLPFNQKSIYIGLFLLSFTLVIIVLPKAGMPLIDITLRCGIMGLLMVYLAYKFSLSDQVTEKIDQTLSKLSFGKN